MPYGSRDVSQGKFAPKFTVCTRNLKGEEISDEANASIYCLHEVLMTTPRSLAESTLLTGVPSAKVRRVIVWGIPNTSNEIRRRRIARNMSYY